MLTTQRLTIRAARLTDLDDLFAVFGNQQAMQYWSTPPDKDVAATRARLTSMIAASAVRPTYFVIEMNGKAVGTAGMHHDNEVGFILRPDYWRQGIISEAMQAIIPYLFETTQVNELTADADPNNRGSVGLLQHLGFVETGTAKNTYCVDGVWSDSVYFSLQRPL